MIVMDGGYMDMDGFPSHSIQSTYTGWDELKRQNAHSLGHFTDLVKFIATPAGIYLYI